MTKRQKSATWKRPFTRTQPFRHLDLGFPASKTEKQMLIVHKPPSLWYFVIAVQTRSRTCGRHKYVSPHPIFRFQLFHNCSWKLYGKFTHICLFKHALRKCIFIHVFDKLIVLVCYSLTKILIICDINCLYLCFFFYSSFRL